MKPQISFEHVLSELSVNRENPCEVLRELISNSYDAGASKITLFPLLDEHDGFIYFDNGDGLCQEVATNGITPYQAFFSIGKSTKREGESIGYKCQGTKLCFATNRFAVFTKTERETTWRVKLIENPKMIITQDYDISPESCDRPWEKLRSLFGVLGEITDNILGNFNEVFFRNEFSKGTLIVLLGLHVDGFREYFSPKTTTDINSSYLYNYIRFFTKHGDTRVTDENQGFRAAQRYSLRQTKACKPNVELSIWCNDGIFSKIPSGFPYLETHEDTSHIIKTPLHVSRLRDGRFFDKYAKVINIHGRNYSLILSIDGNRRALDNYKSLDRKGKKISGIKLADQRGTYVSAHGIKVCPYNVFENSELSDYKILQETESQNHFVFFIDGPFKLVTNRNSLSNESFKILKDTVFIENIKKFLNDFKDSSEVFRELCQRLKNEFDDDRQDFQVNYLEKNKRAVAGRERFFINDIPTLKDKPFVSPEPGEENWVGALYTLLTHFIREQHPLNNYWLRPLTFSLQGIDSICQLPNNRSLDELALKSLEYKYHFSHRDIFNHPLNITDYVVCWTMDEPNIDYQVLDDYNCFGYIQSLDSIEPTVVYQINDVQSRNGAIYNRNLLVISLKELIKKSFNAKFIQPPTGR